MPKERKIPNMLTLKQILNKLNVDENLIDKLTEGLLNAEFFDEFNKYEHDKNTLILIGKSITGDENTIEINIKESTLVYNETISGITRQREYLSNGFDLSKIKLV